MTSDTTETETETETVSVKQLIPQADAHGIFRNTLGFTADELVFIVAPPLVAAIVGAETGVFSPGDRFVELLGLAGVLAFAVKKAPYYLTPYTFAAKWLRYAGSRLRMPLVGGSARAFPGVEDVREIEGPDGFPGPLGIAETPSDRAVAVVAVDPDPAGSAGEAGANTTYLSRGEWIARASSFASTYDAALAKNGIDAQLQFSTRDPAEAGGDGPAVASLDGLAAVFEEPTEDADGRLFAAETVDHTTAQVEQSGVMNRRLAVVVDAEVSARSSAIPFAGPDEAALQARDDTLRSKVKKAAQVAAAAGGRADVLDADAVGHLLRDYWLGDGSAEIDVTDQRVTDRARSVLWGSSWVDGHRRYVDLDGLYTSSLWVSSWPTNPSVGLLSELATTPGVEFDLSLHVGATDRREKIDDLDDKMQSLSTAGWRQEQQGEEGRAGDADRSHGETRALRDFAQDEGVEIVETSATITVRGESSEAVADARTQIEERCRRVGVTATPAHGDHRTGLRTTAPMCDDRLNRVLRSGVGEALGGLLKVHLQLGVDTRADMPTDTLGCLVPPLHAVRRDPDGILYGLAHALHPTTSALTAAGVLQVDRRELTAPHRYVIGRSGAGKTYREIAQLYEELDRGILSRVVIIDIAEQFEGLVEAFDGSKVVPGETLLNPLAISPGTAGSRTEKVNLVTDMLMFYLMDNAAEDRALELRSTLKTTVAATYDRAGITEDPSTHGRDSPVFGDWIDTLEAIDDEDLDVSLRDTEGEREQWREDVSYLLTRFSSFPSEYGFLCPDPEAGDDPEGEVSVDDRVVLFDLSTYQDRNDAAKGMLATHILSHAFRTAKRTGGDSLVGMVVDEAHDVFKDSQRAGRFEATVRAGRNHGLAFDFLSQAAGDFSADEAAVIAQQCRVVVAADLGEDADVGEVESLGFPHEPATAICGGLEPGESSAPFSEAMVAVEGDVYRTEFSTSAVADAMIDYRESDDGAWRDHVDRALLQDDTAGEAADVAEVDA